MPFPLLKYLRRKRRKKKAGGGKDADADSSDGVRDGDAAAAAERGDAARRGRIDGRNSTTGCLVSLLTLYVQR